MSNKVTNRISTAGTYVLLLVVSGLIAGPFYWMLATSFKDKTKVLQFPPQWFPHPIVLENYHELFKAQPFQLYFVNSLYIAIIVTIGTCLLAALAGYSFAKIAFPFKNGIFLLLLSSMMIPTEVTAIPLFVWMTKLKAVDTHFPLIVPPMLGAGGMFGVFLLRQFYITLPKDLDDAAKIDGCSPWTGFLRIMLPMASPALATLAILTFLSSWNEFFEPLIYLNSSKLFTLPIALSLFTDQSGTQWHLIMAASVISTLPLLIVFFFAQRKFIEGIAMSGVK
ncbi:carbohydrate ABC transporter permease [Paenibacillus roseipurpureus]|uniref:Carbohydrate ABC transporter permease n=1 Tax=Paenibacillus roseopurpureus TaxID=2918901 RepID=A0AA96LKQ6_9BACL|nr:carbohydrate ABC transporter permease [Paenibacillus sp. MBLB1832]WNR42871.1 carbohydrate ABC transporter permease [Paenibacillus sp. MBLB1832]